MNNDDKTAGTRKALENFAKRDAKKYAVKKRRVRNKAPEKIVEKAVRSVAKSLGMEIFKTNASAKYNPNADRFLKDTELKEGHSDYSGDESRGGVAVYIETKALGKRSNVTFNQQQFLTRKIKRGCFAVVIDTSEQLVAYYNKWLELRVKDKKMATAYLIDCLPKKSFKRYEDEDFDLV